MTIRWAHEVRGGSSKTRRQLRSRLGIEGLEVRAMLAGDATSSVDLELMEVDDATLDLNEDGAIGPTDALLVLNCLNDQQNDLVPEQRMDVNADGAVSPLDAMMVINRIGRGARNHNGLVSDGMQPDGRGREPQALPERTDVVLAWNNLFNELLVANVENQNPGYASRAMAMLNLAIYDAITVAKGDIADTFYEYDNSVRSARNVNPGIAASEAAYTVLSSLYPDQQDAIAEFRESMRADEGGNRHRASSRTVGNTIGNQVLAVRSNDGSGAIVDYSYSSGVGAFQADPLNPDVPVWGPGWGEVDTFSIGSAESFAPPTTPALNSEEYAASYNEVKELGSVDSTTRTSDQTEAGLFWAYDRVGLGTPMSLFNDVLESVGVQQGNTVEKNAALFAQASVAMADAGIVAWHTKFSEEFWRPVTAIHDGDLDGNPLTVGDSDWTALGAPDGGSDIVGFTPQFPTYISGHATFGGALFGALQEFYGTDEISFNVSSNELEILLDNPELQEAYGLELDDAQRSFDSFSEAMAENGRSRVYLGIHFDFDDLVGQQVGQAVATEVASEFVVPTRGNHHDGPGDPGGPGQNLGSGNNRREGDRPVGHGRQLGDRPDDLGRRSQAAPFAATVDRVSGESSGVNLTIQELRARDPFAMHDRAVDPLLLIDSVFAEQEVL